MKSNETIFFFFNGLAAHSPLIADIAVFLADRFGILILAGLLVYLFTHRDKRQGVRDTVVVLTAGAAAWAAALLLKDLFNTPRPFLVDPDILLLVDERGTDAFPSGHAALFSALAVATYFYHRTLGVFYAIGALLVGLARIIVGVHWPVDILGGLLFGGIVGWGVHYVFSRSWNLILQNERKGL